MSAPHDAPDLGQLVEAVREWIERDVMTSDDGRLRFNSRIAANVLAMVEREIRLGPEHARAHQDRLDSLGVADDGELAARIRDGEFDGVRGDELRRLLRQAIDDKLAVANPGYLDG